MSYRIVTISRQYGSGGRAIGKRLAEKLGINCYDRKIIDRVADESGFDKNYIKEKGELAVGGVFGAMLNRWSYSGLTNEERIWHIQSDIIKNIADKESCVIVGRCADYILNGRDDVLRVFIHAKDDYRKDRITRLYGDNGPDPIKRLRTVDKQRRAYYQIYTEYDFGDAFNYDICLDGGVLGEDMCVEILYNIFRGKD